MPFGGHLANSVQGSLYTWQIGDRPIGSGDAGEVYAVVCLEQPELSGVLKRPARVATAGTIQRQAVQIAQEAHALDLLNGLTGRKAHPPRLLDQAPDYTRGTANYFMVSEAASGEALSTMLSRAHKAGKPFPRRVIITVLDALFDMFSAAHQAGVLWNDVKLEHIYWDNPSGSVSVIDWGNAIFLDDQHPRTHPRWQDYQQMVEALGSFLQSAAPDLFEDLGWDEFHNKTLDASLVSTLARRISYQQQVIALQVMEYQSLIRVILNNEPALEGLRKIREYLQVLELTGAPWEREEILQYSRSLVENSLKEKSSQTTVSVTAQVWEIFNDSLGLPWHLLREYCRHIDILTHTAFPDLVRHTLNARWRHALWTAGTIARGNPVPIWWDALIPAMRQEALQTQLISPYQACRALYTWAKESRKQGLLNQLEPILVGWRVKDDEVDVNPFDDKFLELVRNNSDLPGRIISKARQSYALGEEILRELIIAWQEANWEALSKAFRHLFSWDPDRWSVIPLEDQVESLKYWLKDLYEGPQTSNRLQQFLEEMFTTRPAVDRVLGPIPWLSALNDSLNAILQGAPISSHKEVVTVYCPWLLHYTDICSADPRPPEVENSVLNTLLTAFLTSLKSWQGMDTSLKAIQAQAPSVYPLCQRLFDHFQKVFSLNISPAEDQPVYLWSLPEALREANHTLQALNKWRQCLAEQNLSEGSQCLEPFERQGWVLASQARQVTLRWQQIIIPVLDAIRALKSMDEIEPNPTDSDALTLFNIYQSCQVLKKVWDQVYSSGIFINLLEALEANIESARSSFLDWRVTLEYSSDPVERLVYLCQLDKIRQISNCLMRATHHSHQAKLHFSLFTDGDPVSIEVQKKNIKNILYHLASLEAELITDPDSRRFTGYQVAFDQIADAATAEARHALIGGLTEEHPFYAWLVKSTFA
ncbi:MAG: hypothetical protein BWX85_01349 [Chloroflexi bacterium ADurb.Bin120]|jgi:hypothetical protein|uniref:Protein kinase domain-containing protein n=1 Tax=Candidatus Brevifilum fermentans TaxID=1986204 RepID=A0A1Y6K748_9CHLR|nr:MAG: hypothetical protein BWX85_01349 [Chloroflexi bacterium ADurb.Bin120]SMX53870.1 protein of unknown function [Brevefilum fermentans]